MTRLTERSAFGTDVANMIRLETAKLSRGGELLPANERTRARIVAALATAVVAKKRGE